jgi:hypothetical protein
VGYFIGALVNSHNDPSPTSTGDYIRLFIMFLWLYGPSLVVIAWPISIPVIVVLSLLVACVRRRGVTP